MARGRNIIFPIITGLAMLPTIPYCGGHYFVDVIVGLAIAGVAVGIAHSISVRYSEPDICAIYELVKYVRQKYRNWQTAIVLRSR